jgi:hypothetical protein
MRPIPSLRVRRVVGQWARRVLQNFHEDAPGWCVTSWAVSAYFSGMERSEATASLRSYRAHVAGELERLRAEFQRVNAALRELDGDSAGTLDLLRACAAAHPQIEAPAALRYMTAHGWESEARGNALNAVRSGLAHLAASGEIERIGRGVYRATGGLQRNADYDNVIAGTG